MTTPAQQARALVTQHGETFAEQAGIELDASPNSLWQLLVLANLLSNRIRSDAAVASAQELWRIGCNSPAGTRATSWQQRVDALGRGGYRRYDFSTSTRLGKNAAFVLERYDDDLASLMASPANAVAKALQQFDGIGPTGASIFLREAQSVFPDMGFQVDKLVLKGASAAGLPPDAEQLGQLVEPAQYAAFAAALVRLARNPQLPAGR